MKLKFALLIFSASLLLSCKSEQAEPAQTLTIHEGWQFRQVNKNEWLPATVPGCVHLDLRRHNKIPDLFYRLNEKEVQWIENEDWEYQTNFEADEKLLSRGNIELLFKGLDTYADVYLNDSLLLSANNMHRSWLADCKRFMKQGKNSLRVYFHSPVKIGLKKLASVPYTLPGNNEQAVKRTGLFTRKAPYHYGWDWGPRLVTSGIWRPVIIKAWDAAKIEDVFIVQKNISKDKANCVAQVELKCAAEQEAKPGIFINGSTSLLKEMVLNLKEGNNKVNIDFDIDNPKLWWTRGLGEAYLYDVQVKLMQENIVIDQQGRKVGLRTIKLVQKPDATGTSFYFEVNGVPVFMKGSNYIPPDNLNPGVGVDRYKKVIKAATDANTNMLRVWGGAIYEEDVLYDLCDENGIVVWQDFMFACSMYPGDKEYLENVRLEAEENIKRLRNHPSLALWCGNNENLVAWHKWGWQKEYKISPQDSATMWHAYEKTFYDILPNAVKKYNSEITYWPSSPSSSYYELPNTKSGDVHYWDVWFGSLPLSSYNDSAGRFISEYGLQSFPEFKTYKSFTASEDWDIHLLLQKIASEAICHGLQKISMAMI